MIEIGRHDRGVERGRCAGNGEAGEQRDGGESESNAAHEPDGSRLLTPRSVPLEPAAEGSEAQRHAHDAERGDRSDGG